MRKNSGEQKKRRPGASATSIRNATLHHIGHPYSKRRGEASEAAFIARACHLNLPVAKLWGESDPFDALVGTGQNGQFWRVQVKCAYVLQLQYGRYEVHGGGNYLYTDDDIDFLAAHLVPHDAWYIIPIHAFQGTPVLYLYPTDTNSRGKYEKYREAWCLLACDPRARGRHDIPAHCRCRELPTCCAVCPRKSDNC